MQADASLEELFWTEAGPEAALAREGARRLHDEELAQRIERRVRGSELNGIQRLLLALEQQQGGVGLFLRPAGVWACCTLERGVLGDALGR